ncbi:diguanylate cyclase (GGDEF)-like protein [Anoxybacillus vitaminiphilus]|uniref:Diguanylate cyclase (GGDEF)-like protein n=1 Tax=Paranoxybacillus vitaminiphilus TaxID=581036 RepID=A0A327YME6_9BACL|nr:GGDEF domain-containing protein [Anoxybacillus vitaminiphilus]RAK19419.1 diguanylate cyclase (GGDEF)-like protein [Anoxybacillus vitaminiphilus]
MPKNKFFHHLYHIPKKLWVVIFLSYFIPFFVEVNTPNDLITEIYTETIWFISLLPTLIFAYFFGKKGGSVSVLLSITVLFLSQLIDNIGDDFSFWTVPLTWQIAFTNVVLGFGIGLLAEKLRQKQTALELALAELNEKRKELYDLAFYDPLTHLPNRRLFNKYADEILHYSKEANTVFSIMFLDLDGFKEVNDTLGHEAGDLLLKTVSQRLKKCVRANDIVARIAGDEFIILLPGISHEQAVKIAERVIETLQAPIVIGNNSVSVTTSIGISSYPLDGNEIKMLVKKADIAMYQAKRSGKNNYRIADENAISL